MADVDEKSALHSSDNPDYNALFGEEEKRQTFVQKTPFGEVRNLKRFTWQEWLFLAVATLSILGALAISIERLVYFEAYFGNISNSSSGMARSDKCNEWTCTNDFIFTLVLLLNLLFCVFYCYDGLFRERQFEMISYAIAVTVIIVYVIANYGVNGWEHQPLRLVRLVLVCVLGPVNIVLALVVWRRMGYLAFHTIGSNKEINRAFTVRSVFLTVQDFNLQVIANILILIWARDGDFTSLAEKVVVPVLLVYVLVTMLLGWVGVMYEVKLISIVWYFATIPCLGYYIFKIVNVATNWSDYRESFYEFHNTNDAHDHPIPFHFEYVSTALLVISILGVLVYILMVLLMGALQTFYFGVGLKDKIKPPLHNLKRKILWWYAKRKASSILH